MIDYYTDQKELTKKKKKQQQEFETQNFFETDNRSIIPKIRINKVIKHV